MTAMLYSAELRAVLTNQFACKMSELDAEQQLEIDHRDSYSILMGGVCDDVLWPMSLTSSALHWTNGLTDPTARQAALVLPLSSTALADRANHRVTNIYSYSASSLSDFTLRAKQAIAAGYGISVGWPPNHEVCAMGYTTDGNFTGLDPRDGRPIGFVLGISYSFSISPYFSTVTDVVFKPSLTTTDTPITQYQVDAMRAALTATYPPTLTDSNLSLLTGALQPFTDR